MGECQSGGFGEGVLDSAHNIDINTNKNKNPINTKKLSFFLIKIDLHEFL